MNNNLQEILKKLIESGSQTNPALNTLMTDYTLYHAVFLVTGGLVAILFGLLSIYFGIQWLRAPKTNRRKWTFEKKLYFSFGTLSILLGLLMALIVAANASNVFNPQRGFSLLVDSLSTPPDQLHLAFNTWLESGSTSVPTILQNKFDERTVFHTTKTIVCALLLVAFIVLNRGIWGRLITRFRVQEAKWRWKDSTLFVGGLAAVAFSVLLLVMVVANTQAAFASKTLTLLYG